MGGIPIHRRHRVQHDLYHVTLGLRSHDLFRILRDGFAPRRHPGLLLHLLLELAIPLVPLVQPLTRITHILRRSFFANAKALSVSTGVTGTPVREPTCRIHRLRRVPVNPARAMWTFPSISSDQD